MKKTTAIIAALFLLLAAYLSLWPVPIDPQSWAAPTAPGYSGPHAVNSKLTGVKMISLGGIRARPFS